MRQLEPVRFSSWPVRLALGLPVLIAIALMAPRILDAHFGLFDDPTSISVAQQTWAGQWDLRQDAGFGRFRPVYWLAFSLIYRLAGKQAAWYFVGNLILLAGTAWLLSGIVLRLTHRPLAAGVAGIAFALGGPVIEAAYTLSKPELLQCFFLTASGAALVLSSPAPSRRARAGRVLLGSLFILLAALTKETTGLVLAIALAWLVIPWLTARLRVPRSAARLHPLLLADFLLAAGLGIACFVLGVFALSPTTTSGAGPQANFTFTRAVMAMNARIWLVWLLRDWLYLLPLLVAAACFMATGRRLGQSTLVLGCLVWMGAWLALYLPYRFTPEYYLLPFSLGSAALSGVLALMVVDAARGTRRAERIVATGSAGLAVALFALTIPNNLSNAGIQLSVDNANAAMLQFVADTAPQGGLVLVNIRNNFEYLLTLEPMLHLVYDRPDLAVTPYVDTDGHALAEVCEGLVLSPLIENVPFPSVRLGIPELASREWEASLQQELGGRLKLLREVRYSLDLLTIDASRLPCLVKPGMRYCGMPHTPFDTRRFAEGWRIYSVR